MFNNLISDFLFPSLNCLGFVPSLIMKSDSTDFWHKYVSFWLFDHGKKWRLSLLWRKLSAKHRIFILRSPVQSSPGGCQSLPTVSYHPSLYVFDYWAMIHAMFSVNYLGCIPAFLLLPNLWDREANIYRKYFKWLRILLLVF